MSKRQTVGQPNVDGLKYSLLEQEGKKNRYRLSGRNTTNELITVLGTKEHINEYVGKDIIYISEAEKLESKIKKSSEAINRLFLRLKKETPLKSEINIWQTIEGKNIMSEFLNEINDSNTIQSLFKKLQLNLKDYNLKFSHSPFIYFREKDKLPSLWFNVSFIGEDIVKEKEVKRKTQESAEQLNKIYLRLKNSDLSKKEINIYADPEGQKVITDFVQGTTSQNGPKLLEKLKDELSKYGLSFSYPAYNYFIEEVKTPNIWFNLKEIKIAA
ncbi:MAG: hypothetical protein M0P94_00435 [Candidatus Absconditabacterales bacterium]|nr:hypothetical protein [Candidatus Absconditabacterales bacterium]